MRVSLYQAVIFDMDGVIINSEPLYEQAGADVFARHGYVLPPAALFAVKGKVGEEAIPLLIDACDATGTLDAAVVLAEVRQAAASLLETVQLFDGVLPLLERLHARCRLALTTSARRAVQQDVFGRFGLDPYFSAVVTAEDVSRAKPHPQPYRRTARRLGLPPSACLVVEDAVHGVASAVAAGCTVAGLTTSFHAEALQAAGAHLTVSDLDALAEHLGL